MTTRYNIRLGSSSLEKQHSNIAILNIEYSGIERTSSQQAVANLDGFDVVNEKVNRQTVTVTFEMHTHDIVKRNSGIRFINAWAAKGGQLRTSDRADQYLPVKCEQFAQINARDWTAPMTLVFATTGDPYWRSDSIKTKTISGKNASSTLALDGNISEAHVWVTVTSTKGTVKSIKLTAGSTTLELTGLSIAKDEYLELGYLNDRYLMLYHNASNGSNKGSLLPKLKASSSDQLSIPCGKSSKVSVVADNNVRAVFNARGKWL